MTGRKIGTGAYQINEIVHTLKSNSEAYAQFMVRWKSLIPEILDDPAIHIVELELKYNKIDYHFDDLVRDVLGTYVARKSHNATIDIFCDGMEKAGFPTLADSLREKFHILKDSCSSMPATQGEDDEKRFKILYSTDVNECQRQVFLTMKKILHDWAAEQRKDDVDRLIDCVVTEINISSLSRGQLDAKATQRQRIYDLFSLVESQETISSGSIASVVDILINLDGSLATISQGMRTKLPKERNLKGKITIK